MPQGPPKDVRLRSPPGLPAALGALGAPLRRVDSGAEVDRLLRDLATSFAPRGRPGGASRAMPVLGRARQDSEHVTLTTPSCPAPYEETFHRRGAKTLLETFESQISAVHRRMVDPTGGRLAPIASRSGARWNPPALSLQSRFPSRTVPCWYCGKEQLRVGNPL